MASNAVYSSHSDHVLRNVLATMPTGTLLSSSFPLSNLTDSVPATLCRLSSTTVRWVWDLGTATEIQMVVFGQHNIDAGHTGVVWEQHTSNTWTSPDLSVPVTIPAAERDGYRPFPWVDISAHAARSRRFVSFAVKTANSVNLAMGEVMASAVKRIASPNLSWGMQEGESVPGIEHQTGRGVRFAYRTGIRVRNFAGEVDTTDAEATSIKEWFRDSNLRPFIWIPDGSVNDAMIVSFEMGNELKVTREFFNRNRIPLAFREWSRGVQVT
jgi:hypothetical protein